MITDLFCYIDTLNSQPTRNTAGATLLHLSWQFVRSVRNLRCSGSRSHSPIPPFFPLRRY